MSTDVMHVLSGLRPEDAAHASELFPPGRRMELLEHIISTERTAAPSRDDGPVRTFRFLPAPLSGTRRQALLLCSLGVLAVAAIAVGLFGTSAVGPQPAAAAVTFRATPGGDIIATVTNPLAAESQLKAAFAAHGFHIAVNLIPVSPSLIGTALYISDDGGASSIEPLQGGHCMTPGGGCPIGVKIPKTFMGQGYITLGRPARPGEQYASAGNATAAGEAMHDIRFKGRTVATVLASLRARHITAPQYRWDNRHRATALRPDQVPATWHVTGAIPWAPRQVLLIVAPNSK